MSAAVDLHQTGAVIVGAGIGGLATALKLAPMPVMVLSATPPGEGAASAWAQGGIAAALASDDSPDLHAADTMTAAAGLADPAIVRLVTQAAPGCIDDLVALGVGFDRDGAGRLRLGREGGHGRHRIVHAAGDATGGEIMRALLKAAGATPSITLVEGAEAQEIVVIEGEAAGVVARRRHEAIMLAASRVVVASGGVGGLYRRTSNPLSARGRGVAMAARAGAVVTDVEFVQFHPTALDVGRDPMPLVTEALRGEGAVLVDESGTRFMVPVHPLAELAPRDVVARAIWRRRCGGGRVWLDARQAVGAAFPQRFPTVYAACRDAGIDPVAAPIPVAPAAHYHMGGVAVDSRGRSSIPGLWAVGEVAGTGLHGANRLASNSLLEALVFAGRAAEDIRGTAPASRRSSPAFSAASVIGEGDAGDPAACAVLRGLMDAAVGVERDAAGLRAALETLRRLLETTASPSFADAALVAAFIATAALRRCESRGGHHRVDHPRTSSDLAARHALTLRDLDLPAVGARADASARRRGAAVRMPQRTVAQFAKEPVP